MKGKIKDLAIVLSIFLIIPGFLGLTDVDNKKIDLSTVDMKYRIQEKIGESIVNVSIYDTLYYKGKIVEWKEYHTEFPIFEK